MERNHLEELLHVNGFSCDAAEDDIRNVLLSASYTNEEIDKALLTLTEEKHPEIPTTSEGEGNRKLFRSGERLQPAEISQLLGVDVMVNEVVFTDDSAPQKFPLARVVMLGLTSAVVAGVVLMGYMYSQRIGIFHPEMGSMSFTNDV